MARIASVNVVLGTLAALLLGLGNAQASESGAAALLWAPSVSISRTPTAGGTQAGSLEAVSRRLAVHGDHSQGQAIEVGGDRVKHYEYRESFQGQSCVDDPAVEGVSCLRWDASAPALWIEGREAGQRRVTLTYHFACPYDTKELSAELMGEIQGSRNDYVELALSRDGQQFGHAARAYGRSDGNPFHLSSVPSHRFDVPTFWIRISAEVTSQSRIALRLFRAWCRVKPPETPQVALSVAGGDRLSYRDTFASTKLLHLAEIRNAAALEWQRGGVFLRGQEGSAVQVAVRQRFQSPAPLRSIAVRIRNAASLSGSNTFGISVDGSTLIASKTTPGPDGAFNGTTELRVEDTRLLADARQFYLHITLANGGQAAAEPSNILSGIEVEARSAEPVTQTAALPTLH